VWVFGRHVAVPRTKRIHPKKTGNGHGEVEHARGWGGESRHIFIRPLEVFCFSVEKVGQTKPPGLLWHEK